jgi:phosphoglycerate dehydrogenase-like enzyme
MSDLDILVLRQKIHGMDATGYAEILEERLPDCSVTLAKTPEQERQGLETANVVTGFELSPEEVASADSLDLFSCVFAGTSHLDLDAFEDNGVLVTNASGTHGPNISEYVIGRMISHAKQFGRARRQQDRREWRSYQTREIHDATVTIVGLGAIGEAVADRLDAFGAETIGVRHTPEKDSPTDEVYGYDEIHEAVADSEYVVIACPLTDDTAGLFDEDMFQTMHPDSVLINVGRGPIVDTEDLLTALHWNRIAGASLDVVDPEPLPEDHPLWGMDNVFITPHNSGYSPVYYERRSDILVRNVERLRAGALDDMENRVV